MQYILGLQRAIEDTRLKFLLVLLVLGAVITIGSFYLIGYVNFAIERQMLFAKSIQYRIEYLSKMQGSGFMTAAGSAFSSSNLLLARAGSTAQGIPVLTYHSIVPTNDKSVDATVSSYEGANVNIENFKDQMFTLKKEGWNTITYQEFEAFMQGERRFPEKSFLLTFDDGAKNSFYPVEPLLQALGYTAVSFILPAHSTGNRSSYYLNRDEVAFMQGTGNWEVQSHGQDIHVSLPTVSDASVRENALSNRLWLPTPGRLETHEEYAARINADLATAKRDIKGAFGVDATGFAFPFGDFGQNGSNDAEAEATVLAAAKEHYTLAFYQNWNQGDFTLNYPNKDTFLIKRVPVRPDWNGEKLLSILTAASPKPLPYAATLSASEGWVSNWGEMKIENGTLQLRASPYTTGAIAILDGTYAWKDYKVEAEVEWKNGYVMMMFGMQTDKVGRACVYENGTVQLQERTAEDILIRRVTKKLKEVAPGKHTIGAVLRGTTSACLFDGKYVIDATLPAMSGGIGVEAWDTEFGNAEAFIKSISVTKE